MIQIINSSHHLGLEQNHPHANIHILLIVNIIIPIFRLSVPYMRKLLMVVRVSPSANFPKQTTLSQSFDIESLASHWWSLSRQLLFIDDTQILRENWRHWLWRWTGDWILTWIGLSAFDKDASIFGTKVLVGMVVFCRCWSLTDFDVTLSMIETTRPSLDHIHWCRSSAPFWLGALDLTASPSSRQFGSNAAL